MYGFVVHHILSLPYRLQVNVYICLVDAKKLDNNPNQIVDYGAVIPVCIFWFLIPDLSMLPSQFISDKYQDGKFKR